VALTVHLDIVSAEKAIFSGLAELIVTTAEYGEVGIQPGHAPLLAKIKPGDIRVTKQGGEEFVYYVSGGVIEVQPDLVTVLADTVIRADELDEAAALASQEHAQTILADQKASEFDFSNALRELAEAVAQIKAIRKWRKRSKK